MVNRKLKREFVRSISDIRVFQDITLSPGGKGFRLRQHEKDPTLPLSPFYLNFRLLQSNLDVKMVAVLLFQQMIATNDTYDPDILAAIPEAIVPVVSTLSDRTRISMITPRVGKTHGSGSKIDGIWREGATAALFDDVLTSGESIITACDVLRANSINVDDVYVLVDRQQSGGSVRLMNHGLRLHAAFKLDELLGTLTEMERLTSKQYDDIMTYCSGK